MATTVGEYAGAIKSTVTSFWHGMSVTLSHLFRRPPTIQYPDRTPLPVPDMLPPRYRGFLEVDASICTVCQACERACPIGCIQITLEKDPANPKLRFCSQFDIDEAKCMYCGLCVEQCPTGSIQHTREFEGSVRNVRNLVFRWADASAPFPVYKVDKSAEYYPRAPLGSLVRAKIEALAWDAPAPEFLPPEPPRPAAAERPAPAAKAPPAKPAAADPAAASAAPPVTPSPRPSPPAVAGGEGGVTPTPAAASAAPPVTPSPRPSLPAGAGTEGGVTPTPPPTAAVSGGTRDKS